MIINGGIYNAPFCLQVGSIESLINESKQLLGNPVFGAKVIKRFL